MPRSDRSTALGGLDWWRVANSLEDLEDVLGEVSFHLDLTSGRILRDLAAVIKVRREEVETLAARLL